MSAFRASSLLRTRFTPPLFEAPKSVSPNKNGPVRPGSTRTSKAPSTTTPPSSSSSSPNFDRGNPKSLWESWKALKPRTRQIIGAVGVVIALAGEYGSTWLQENMPDNDSGSGSSFRVRVVDRQQAPTPTHSS